MAALLAPEKQAFSLRVAQASLPVIRSGLGAGLGRSARILAGSPKGFFRMEDEAAVEVFRTALRLDDRQKNAILNLPDQHLLLRRPDIPYPFLVRVPQLY